MTALTVDELLELHRIGMERHGGLGTIPKDARVVWSQCFIQRCTGETISLDVLPRCYPISPVLSTFPMETNDSHGVLACVRALEINGFSLEVSADEAESFVYQVVTDHHLGFDEIAEKLADWLVELPAVDFPDAASEMVSSRGGEINAAVDSGGDDRA